MMTNQYSCDDKDTLIAYLYGEIEPAVRRAVDAHVAACAACAAEISALGDVRSELGAWAAPNVPLDFTIVKKSELPSTVLRPAAWWQTVPAWAQAAAAILVLAAGASIANLQIRSDQNGLSVTTGWMRPAASEPAPSDGSVLAQAPPAAEEWRTALTALERQLRQEIRSTREQDARLASSSHVDQATIRRVQQLIAEAEQRHERALAQRFVEFTRDVNMQRRADLARITDSFGAYDQQFTRQLMQQRQMLNNVIRTSSPQQ